MKTVDLDHPRVHWARKARHFALAALSLTTLEGNGQVPADNLGINAQGGFAMRENLIGINVYESAENDTDLNGDGDTLDMVIHVYDTNIDNLTNLGVHGAGIFIDGGLLAFTSSEFSQGNVDINGDGDLLDNIPYFYDSATGLVGTPAIAGAPYAPTYKIGANSVIFRAHEGWEGNADLNGDGDTSDNVVHIYNTATGVTTNLGISADIARASGNIATFWVKERDQGSIDLNGDGDDSDQVIHTYDASTGVMTNLGLANSGDLTINNDKIILLVPEGRQGNTDLNGDGDTLDDVVHVYDLSTNTTTNLNLNAGTLRGAGRWSVIPVREANQGSTDLNGDGDATDTVVHIFDASSGTVSNTGYDASDGLLVDGNLLAMKVAEWQQGATDLNADGDYGDSVLHVLDLPSGAVTNVGMDAGQFNLKGHLLAFEVSENRQGRADLNRDGDTSDKILHVHNTLLGITSNLRLSSTYPQIYGDIVAFGVSESLEGDLNGDGDAGDTVVHFHDANLNSVLNAGYAMPFSNVRLSGRVAAFSVSEGSQGQSDLNGDADTSDNVIHLLHLDPGLFPLNADPIADAGHDLTAECAGLSTPVTLDGTGSSDPDDDPLNFQWSAANVIFDDPTSATPTGQFPMGPTLVTLTVTDGKGGMDVSDVLVTVQDTTAPVVLCTTDEILLWPPDHSMRPVQISVAVTDACAPDTTANLLCWVSSNELDDATGDGSSAGDVDGADGFSGAVEIPLTYNQATKSFDGIVLLRAERDGAQEGRVYSITCDVTDPSNNTSTASCVVVVPRNQGNGK